MILNNLIYEFLESPIGQGVLSKLKTRNVSELYFHGLTDSAKGFFLTCLISSVNRPILYLANDSSSALKLYHEITNLTSLPIFYFTNQEVSAYDQIQSDVEVISHQAKTISHLLNKKEPCLIISTGKYLLEKLWNKDDLIKHCFKIDFNTIVFCLLVVPL